MFQIPNPTPNFQNSNLIPLIKEKLSPTTQKQKNKKQKGTAFPQRKIYLHTNPKFLMDQEPTSHSLGKKTKKNLQHLSLPRPRACTHCCFSPQERRPPCLSAKRLDRFCGNHVGQGLCADVLPPP
jgi:hypothetical protein